MFKLDGNLTFVTISQTYLSSLHNACSEVYYKPSGYSNKPYIGILICENNKKYVIPLSSAKEKHKTWKNEKNGCFLVYEITKKSSMKHDDIWVEMENGSVKHILSVIDVKKMIPIVAGTYSRVNINPMVNDSAKDKSYKALLNKEFSFCVKNKNDIVKRANKVYEKQMKTGRVEKFCCDFKALEAVASRWGI